MALDVDIYHGDYGVTIRVNCFTSVASATSRKLMVKNIATGTITEVTATLDETDNNYIKYVIPASGSPFTTYGRYQCRAKIAFSGSQQQQGDIFEVVVGESWTIT